MKGVKSETVHSVDRHLKSLPPGCHYLTATEVIEESNIDASPQQVGIALAHLSDRNEPYYQVSRWCGGSRPKWLVKL